MFARVIHKSLCTGILLAIFISEMALAAVANPNALARLPGQLPARAVTDSVPQEEMVSQLMVKPRYRAGEQLRSALRVRDASALAQASKVAMSVVRQMSGGGHVIRLDKPVTLSEARVIAARLMQDGSVELAEPDRLKHPLFVIPNDPSYTSRQWNLFVPSPQNLGGANLPNAWGISAGSNTVTVAVLDTGYRPHQDFGAVMLPGYDFISDVPTANDGDGRDADAQDPGDWITGAENIAFTSPFYACGALDSRNRPVNKLTPSSWHGTHVAGTIAAQMNNGIGIAGVSPNIQLLPVRVLGKCGGYDSDIIDGMRWAAGLAVAGVPSNPHPAQVLNMSLGGGGGPCSAAYQSAVTDIVKAGKVIVVASGNDGASTIGPPSNCTGVIAVTAHAIDGDNAWYATIGPGTTISAPGGDCGGMNANCIAAHYPGIFSLINSGTTTPVASPGGDTYTAYSGTSMATPHVAAVAALMLSVNPALTPAQISAYLQSSARPHPPGTICTQPANSGMCGAGLLDAYQALTAVKTSAVGAPAVVLNGIPAVVAPGDVVALSGSATTGAGRNIASYFWTRQTGPSAIAISNANTPNASFVASVAGTYTFKLTVTDSGGQTGSATAVVVVNSPPVLKPVPAQTVVAGQALNFSVSAADSDGDTQIIFHAVNLRINATLSATGNFSWPNATPPGNYTLVYYASDQYNSNSAQGTVNITVTAAPAVTSPFSAGGKGGGGSLDAAMLAILASFAIGLRLCRRCKSK